MNKVEEEWKTKLAEYESQELLPISRMCYDLAYLVAEKGKGVKVKFGQNEGFHRVEASIQALTGMYIDPLSGVLSRDLQFDDFVKEKLIHPDDIPDDTFQSHVQLALDGPCMFFDSNSTVDVWYISSPIDKVATKPVLNAFRVISEQRSDNKLMSVRKPCWAEVGNLARATLEELPENNVIHRPRIPETCTFKMTVEEKKASAISKIDDAKVKIASLVDSQGMTPETEAFGILPYFCSREYSDYLSNPFGPNEEENFKRQFTYFAMDDGSVKISPPFLNSNASLIQDPTSSEHLNTWTINGAYFIPKIVHYLYADSVNKPFKNANEDGTCYKMAAYLTRYHTNNYGSSNSMFHRAKDHFYNTLEGKSPYLTDILASVLYIVDTINVALTHPGEWMNARQTSNDPSLLKQKLKDTGVMMDTMYSNMTSANPSVKLTHCFKNLGA